MRWEPNENYEVDIYPYVNSDGMSLPWRSAVGRAKTRRTEIAYEKALRENELWIAILKDKL